MRTDLFKGLPASGLLEGFIRERHTRQDSVEFKRLVKANIQEIPPVQPLRQLLNRPERFSNESGNHPDFSHLKDDQCENAAITSVFLDIKGSTSLNVELPLCDVARLKNALLLSASMIVQLFDGHVHRFQGDALVCFFGRKTLPTSTTIVDALNAVTTVVAYVESYLNPMFKAEGWDPIEIRVGVDYGSAEQTLWSAYGSPVCGEITATGLHVDLAAKLQHKARANGIMIGDNVRAFIDLPEEFFKVRTRIKDSDEYNDVYIFRRRGINYRMWDFNWRQYAQTFTWLRQKSDGQFEFHQENGTAQIVLDAYVLDENGNKAHRYLSSMQVLPKDVKLHFELVTSRMPVHKGITWFVENRGREVAANNEKYEIQESRNKTYTVRDTVYLGHHYLICKVDFGGGRTAIKKIGVFIGPENDIKGFDIQKSIRPVIQRTAQVIEATGFLPLNSDSDHVIGTLR